MKRFLPLISFFVLFMLMLSGFAHAQTAGNTAPLSISSQLPTGDAGRTVLP
ncbi:hypothetical protein GU926_14555 [Nibribacter ruber]|uniref:Uncharacterized protein n=1 Tax=Nibribacter ruber TaxID=2698458 RepID=A0A6P1P2F3_9BACT|nr:hypothetical protein [Nibribacter ruber]QHL88584.1 hypothetical protein GU926_14555 [Nibribacter ruber]